MTVKSDVLGFEGVYIIRNTGRASVATECTSYQIFTLFCEGRYIRDVCISLFTAHCKADDRTIFDLAYSLTNSHESCIAVTAHQLLHLYGCTVVVQILKF